MLIFIDILRVIRLLLWQRQRVLVHTFQSASVLSKLLISLGVLIALGGAWLEYLLVRLFIHAWANLDPESALLNDPAFAAIDLEALRDFVFQAPVLLAVVLTLGLTITGVAHGLSSLFFSTDMQRLMLAPVPTRAIFAGKLILGMTSTSFFLVYGWFIPLSAYGSALQAPSIYYLALLISTLLLPVLPLLLGAVGATLLLRIIPAHRTKEFLGVFASFFGISCYLIPQIFLPEEQLSDLAQQLDTALIVDQPWLPTSWLGRGLAGLVSPQGTPVFFVVWVVVSLALFISGIMIIERLYRYGWLALQSSPQKRKQRRLLGLSSWQRWDGQTRALLQKERRMLLRDVRNLLIFIWPLAFLGLWIWRSIENVDSIGSAGTGLIFLAFIVCETLSSRLALASISREHSHYWVLRIAPVSMVRVWWSKWFFAWLVYPLLSLLLLSTGRVVGVLTSAQWGYGWLGICIVGIGAAALATSFGVAYPKLDWEQPEQMISQRAGCLGRISGWVYSLCCIALLAGAFAAAVYVDLQVPVLVTILCGAGAVILTAVVVWFSVIFGTSQLEHHEL